MPSGWDPERGHSLQLSRQRILDQDGSVTNPPAPKSLAETKTTVFEGKVYVTG
jgi:hypothetical protein